MTDSALDWSLLPDHPEKFFGVSKNDDEREARRAYTRMIRIYKPDSHPDEFMKIRAAYEKLTLLRNIQRSEAVSGEEESPATDGDSSVMEDDNNGADEAKPVSLLTSLRERLQLEDPVSAYAWMRNQPLTSPVHYYCLGLLSDVVKEDKQSNFETWVLEGVRAFPDDRVLATLLGQLCARSQRPDDIGEVAIRGLHAKEIYAQFPVIRASLLHCSPPMRLRLFKRLLTDARNATESEDVFWYCRLLVDSLKSAASLDDPAVLREVIEILDENHTYIPDEANPLIDAVELYHRYLESRGLFLNGDPYRVVLDGMIQEYIRNETFPHNAFQRVCRQGLADPEGFLSAFPREDKDCQAALAMVATIMRFAVDTDEELIQYPGREGGQLVLLFMRLGLYARTVRMIDAILLWGFGILVFFSAMFLIYFTAGPTIVQSWGYVFLGAIVGMTSVFSKRIQSWFKASRIKRFLAHYEGIWRAGTIRFLCSSGLYWNEFAYSMKTSTVNDSGENKYFQEQFYGDMSLRMLYFGLEYEPRALPGRRDEVS